MKTFETIFGFPPPPALREIFSSKLRSWPLPVQLRFRHVPYVLEIQHLRDLDDSSNYDAHEGRLCFAVTSDGNELLIDVRSPDMPILQRENGDIDTMGLNVAHLLDAEYSPLELLGRSWLREAVRRRPGMFVGTIGNGDGAKNFATSLLVNALHFRSAKSARLDLGTDGDVALTDDGEPLPAKAADWTTLNRAESFVTRWLTAPSGVELSVLAVLSEHFVARTSGGLICFDRGVLVDEPPSIPVRAPVRVHARLDADVFGSLRFPNANTLYAWARDYAATSPGTTLHIESATHGGRTFHYPNGLKDLLAEFDASRTRAHPDVLSFTSTRDTRSLSVAIRFCHTGPQEVVSFVNHQRTSENGAHADGALNALQSLLQRAEPSQPFIACISLLDPEPEWEGSTKERLLGNTVRAFVRDAILENSELVLAVARSVG